MTKSASVRNCAKIIALVVITIEMQSTGTIALTVAHKLGETVTSVSYCQQFTCENNFNDICQQKYINIDQKLH